MSIICQGLHTSTTTSIHGRTDFKFESHLYIIETKCVSDFDILNVLGEENSIVHVPTTTSIHGRTDFKFESLLYITETKCVSEFDILNVLGEENSM